MRDMGSKVRIQALATLPLAAALLLPACQSASPPPDVKKEMTTEKSTAIEAPWTVSYLDGSANSYQIWQEDSKSAAKLKYTPVKPEQSSTGHYSGGEPVEKTLDAGSVAELWRQLRALEADTANRAKARGKGTGMFRFEDKARGNLEFLVERVPALLELDRLLASLRAR